MSSRSLEAPHNVSRSRSGWAVPVILTITVVGLVTACSDGAPVETQPKVEVPGLRIVGGADATDTIESLQAQALVVEVRLPDGRPAVGAEVRFETRLAADPARRADAPLFVCSVRAQACRSVPLFDGNLPPAIDSTDQQGRARAVVRMGRVAGRSVVSISAPALALKDSASFRVLAGALAGVRSVAVDTAILIDETVVLRGTATDRFGNARPEPTTIAASVGNAVGVEQSAATVTGLEIGAQQLLVRCEAYVDSMTVRVVPAATILAWSAPGEAIRFTTLSGRGVARTVATQAGGDFGAFPRFSGDGTRISYHTASGGASFSQSRVFELDSAGILRRTVRLDSRIFGVLATRITTDGTIVVVGSVRGNWTRLSVLRIAANDSITRIDSVPDAPYPQYGGADISPDGRYVAYVATPIGLPGELRVFDVETNTWTRLAHGGSAPRWSPAGDRIAFLAAVTQPVFLARTLQVMNRDGTARRIVSTRPFEAGIAWSPDAAFLVGRSGSLLYVTRVGNGAQVPLILRNPAGGAEEYFQADWR